LCKTARWLRQGRLCYGLL
nr:immunoglobulin heavy chain junction region [Mus musculus]